MELLVNPGATTMTLVGFASLPTISGTLANADDTGVGGGPFIGHASAASSGDPNGIFGVVASDPVYPNWGGDTSYRIKSSGLSTSQRIWVGWTNVSIDSSDTPTIRHVAAFRYSTSAADANWQAVTCNAAPGCTVTDTGVVFATSTKYTFRIVFNGSTNVKFYIDGSLVATSTTTLPGPTTALGYIVRAIPLSASARSISWGRVAVVYQ